MAKRVLAVGNCSLDHSLLAQMLQRQFGAEVIRAANRNQTLDALRAGPFDLVLINRVLASDGSAGTDLIAAIKADPQLSSTPVMLLSDYPDAQAAAVAAGAEAGFGKSQLDSATAAERLAPFLAG